MENICNVLKQMKCKNGNIKEFRWIDLLIPSGKLVVSDFYECYSNEVCQIDFPFDKSKAYSTYIGKTDDYVVYLKIEIIKDEIAYLSGIEKQGKIIQSSEWNDYSCYDGSLNGECNFSISDADIMQSISKYIKNKYNNDYSLLVDEVDPKIALLKDYGLVEIDNFQMPYIYTPNSSAICFLGKNKKYEVVSIIIEFGVCDN